MKRSVITLLPLLVLALMLFMFADRLASPRASGSIDSPLIGKLLPALSVTIPATVKPPYIVNVFASWCAPCVIEHPYLMALQKKGVTIIGIAYKDKKDAIKAYLARHGNPYAAVLYDDAGDTGITLGITGVPESFAVDVSGIVRARQQGPFADDAQTADFMKGVMP